MERWKKQIEYWVLYLILLAVCILSLAGRRNNKFFLLMFAISIPSCLFFVWIQKGMRVERIKNFMEKHRIRPIHLWIGSIVAYYGIVGVNHLL